MEDEPPLVLRVGEQNDGLRVLLASFGVETAAFLSAWNPNGEAESIDNNLDLQAALLNEVEKLRLNYFVGSAQHPDGDYREENYLVLGISREQSMALSKRFGQPRFVWLDMRGLPELVLMDSASGGDS
ncbi:MAG: DUF3293 domain-containing protein [Pseudomonadales bacterium]|nr:DUF3293 domain-containing protein [Pseudomonadales bacterium]